jgi:hypothetical protein
VSWVLLALQLALAVVLLLAATGKALRSAEFVAALRLSHLPEGVVAPLAVAVPVVELALAAALVLAPGWALPLALGGTVLLLGAFTIWMAWVRARGLRVSCGCFGPGGSRIGARTIGRNLLLLGLAVGGLVLVLAGRASSPLPGPSLPMTVTVTSLAMCLALFDGLRAAWPQLVLTFDGMQAREAGGE